MNKLPKAVGMGFSLALGTGALFSPANAEVPQSAIDHVECHTGYFTIGMGGVVEYPVCDLAANPNTKPQAMVGPAKGELSNGLQNNETDYVRAIGFLSASLAGIALIGYGGYRYATYQVDQLQADLYHVASEPLSEPADISELVAANRHHAALELASIARTYHIMQNAQTIEVDAAWIISQAPRTDEQ